MSPSNKKKYITHSEEETFNLAKTVAQSLMGNEVILLKGKLGSGKTIFTKGIASGCGLNDIDQVCSPSYVLINIYKAKYNIYHIDLYRLDNESEIQDLGWEDFLDRGIIIFEWAQKLEYNFTNAIEVDISIGENEERHITITSHFSQ